MLHTTVALKHTVIIIQTGKVKLHVPVTETYGWNKSTILNWFWNNYNVSSILVQCSVHNSSHLYSLMWEESRECYRESTCLTRSHDNPTLSITKSTERTAHKSNNHCPSISL